MSLAMSKIHIISSSLVRMTTPTVVTTLDLTPWDAQYLQLAYIQKGILFRKPVDRSPTHLVTHLEASLSRTLDFFPPLSGRLATTENDDKTTSFFIDCNDAGVEFIHAVADDLLVSDVLETRYIPEVVSSLFALNDTVNCEGVHKPLLGVQVTELLDGIFIGCSGNHSVMDGVSFWHFFHCWSQISCGLDKVTHPPVLKRMMPEAFSDQKHGIRISLPPADEKSPSNKLIPPPLLERVFHFSKDDLMKLKDKAKVEAPGSQISTLQALTAHLWRGVLRSRQMNDRSENCTVRFDMVIGGRRRIPLPDGYFGNAAYIAIFYTTEQQVLQNGMGFVAKMIEELVRQQTREAVVRVVEDWIKDPKIESIGAMEFIISSSPRHNVYGCDFGWGKPIAVRSGKAQKFNGKMTLYPAAQPGGIDVEVCLAPETLKAMENDEEFMEGVSD